MLPIFDIASKISTPLALAGIVVTAVFFIVKELIKRGLFSQLKGTQSFAIFKRALDWVFAFGILALVLGFSGYALNLLAPYWNKSEVYQVSINVLDPDQRPVRDAEVVSSPSGVLKKTDSGWELHLPDSAFGWDKTLRVWATRENGVYRGSSAIVLSDDHKPRLTITLQRDLSARIRGQVTDDNGKPLSGAVVYVANYPNEKVTTGTDGLFDVAAHAAAGQHVHVFIESEKHQSWNDVIPAGGESLASIALTKK